MENLLSIIQFIIVLIVGCFADSDSMIISIIFLIGVVFVTILEFLKKWVN